MFGPTGQWRCWLRSGIGEAMRGHDEGSGLPRTHSTTTLHVDDVRRYRIPGTPHTSSNPELHRSSAGPRSTRLLIASVCTTPSRAGALRVIRLIDATNDVVMQDLTLYTIF